MGGTSLARRRGRVLAALIAAVLASACGSKTVLWVDRRTPRMDAGPLPLDTGPPPIDVGPPPFDAGVDAGRDAGVDAGRDAGVDAGRDAGVDAGPLDAGPCPPGCDTGCPLFTEGFESGTGTFEHDGHWQQTPSAFEGSGALNGLWSRDGPGCPVTTSAEMRSDVDLRGATSALFSFAQTGRMAQFDTLRVTVSTDGGSSWSEVEELEELVFGEWREQRLDLGRWLGQPRVRFGFEFDNVCGDPFGVDWSIDSVAVCAER